MNRIPQDASAKPVNPSWHGFLSNLRGSAQSKDPIAFIEWPEVRKTMFYDAPLQEWKYLISSPFWSVHRSAILETAVGTPRPYIADPSTSGNLVHHAYHIAQLMEKCGADINSMNDIVELGGGYGSMYRLVRHMGFAGEYTIFDLPEFLSLQRYFLSMIGLYDEKSVKLTSDIKELAKHRDCSLAIMTWSLSEMPLILRDELIASIGAPEYILIGYQKNFDGIDNMAYFAEMQTGHPGYSWHEHEISHMPGNYYLFGKRLRK